MKKIKLFIWSVLNLTNLGPLIQLALRSELKDSGWFLSYKTKRSVDKNGHPIPWYNYSIIHFLDSRLNKSHKVFEFGAGYSTLWYAKRVASVHAVESDKDWITILKPSLPNNVNVVFHNVTSQDYVKEVTNSKDSYDIIVVDGRRRNECIAESIHALNSRGILILDNSDRVEYSQGIELLTKSNFKSIRFFGMTPITANSTCTTIFYRTENCFDI